jgi:hypothetical protein
MIKIPHLKHFFKILWGIFTFLLINSFLLQAQRCPVPELLQDRESKNPKLKSGQFEQWMQQKISVGKSNLFQEKSQIQSQILQVPVVFHIIHKGESIGTGTNLSQERIDRQLAILNEDFNKSNADTLETLLEFQLLASNAEIEFVYARQDPQGFETTGIVRVLGSAGSYSYQNRSSLSAESYWPAESYLNIWVADLAGSSLGWAEFPVSNLPGLEEASNNRLIDGVSVDYLYFGENPSSPSFESKGRTATHEMGHFFGLRHIWGDGGCAVDDYCDDTPESSSSSTGCNLSKTTCGTLDMVQNFMDYTDDACMSLFSLNQRARMRTVIENSPRRLSLTTSEGLNFPPIFNRDLALSALNPQFSSNCTEDFVPRVQLINNGLDSAANYEVNLFINNQLIESIPGVDTLLSEQVITLNFSTLSIVQYGNYELNYEVNYTDGQADQRIENNSVNEFIQKLEQLSLPYQKTFGSSLNSWQIRNEDGEETWRPLNGFFGIPFFENKQNLGQIEQLISPIFDLTEMERPELSFVFSQSADTLPHKFQIYASFDCGETYNHLVYSASNQSMLTAFETEDEFTPQYRLDWDTIQVDLNYLKNETSVSFNLIAENRNGNNLYINQLSIGESGTPAKRVSPTRWVKTNPLICDQPIISDLEIENTGRFVVNSFLLEVFDGSVLIYSETIDSTLTVGEKIIILIPELVPEKNDGTLKAIISTGASEELVKSELFLAYKVDCTEELAPLRLILLGNNQDNWYSFNPNDNATWLYDPILQVVSSNSSISQIKNSEDWLITPVLDVSRVNYLGLIFDIAYRKPYKQSESFEILVTGEDGLVFNTLIYEKKGDSLATAFGNDENSPQIWRNEFVDLSPFVYRDKIRLAFKVRHENGQNIFLKNVSFFIGKTPPPAYPATNKNFVVYPNPANDIINLHLNLPDASEGFFQITDLQGKVILQFNEPKLLNQFINFDVSSLADGMYLLHLRTDNNRSSERFVISR